MIIKMKYKNVWYNFNHDKPEWLPQDGQRLITHLERLCKYYHKKNIALMCEHIASEPGTTRAFNKFCKRHGKLPPWVSITFYEHDPAGPLMNP